MHTFLELSRLWISTTLSNISGRSLVPSMDRRQKPQPFGPNKHAICLCMATLKNCSPPSLPCPLLLPSLGRAAVCLKKLVTTLPPTPSGCVILLFEHRGCISAVGSLKRLVRRLWLLASSAPACAGPLMAWMLFCLCALPFSTRPTTISGRANRVLLLNHPQLIHTHGQSSTDHLTLKWVICVKWQPFLSAPRLVLYRRISEQTRKDNRFSAT